ncbi:hypothetical protein N7490_011608 [Penicillium lividum]|nr:hypothetical protein N7490_011608 [Penicillium lividum]
MGDNADEMAHKALNAMATASTTIREAIAASLPVGPTQLLTVQVPGTVLDLKDYKWDRSSSAFMPLATRVAEAKLVDNMVPVSKIMMGRSGKSVARSYLAALDYLVPVAASVSGTIAMNQDKALEPRLQIIRDRYKGAMRFLKSPDDMDQTRSKVSIYVAKQAAWNEAVEQYAKAQERQLDIVHKETPSLDEQRQKYLEWVQAHARDYRAAIQARYMDWVVHGYKFEVEFNFGIVDISSGMKRVESSKEAYRNMTMIAEDGASEYNVVSLNPTDWANIIAREVDNWGTKNHGPSAVDIRGEIKRLRRLLISHEALLNIVDKAADQPAVAEKVAKDKDEPLKKAYEGVYTSMNQKNQNPNFKDLREEQEKWANASLDANHRTNSILGKASKQEAKVYIESRIKILDQDIKVLETQLKAIGSSSAAIMPSAVDAEGKTIDEQELHRNTDLSPEDRQSTNPSPWTHITAKVSQSSSQSTKVSKETASSFAARANFGLFRASGGASHSSASNDAMSSMANLDVEISMDCMLVEINRPWLHAELFSDHELDATDGFPISPGPEKLHESVRANKAIPAQYAEFPSYSTAFVVACNVELEFSGDTSSLESSLESSSTEANLSVGYGPFAISGSHKQSKSSAKTKAESTANGMRISLQAPQIIGWVQELLPELPKPRDANNRLFGLSLEAGVAAAAVSPATPIAPAPP